MWSLSEFLLDWQRAPRAQPVVTIDDASWSTRATPALYMAHVVSVAGGAGIFSAVNLVASASNPRHSAVEIVACTITPGASDVYCRIHANLITLAGSTGVNKAVSAAREQRNAAGGLYYNGGDISLATIGPGNLPTEPGFKVALSGAAFQSLDRILPLPYVIRPGEYFTLYNVTANIALTADLWWHAVPADLPPNPDLRRQAG